MNQILNSIDSQKESLSENPIYSLLKLLPHAYQKMLPWRSDTFHYQFEQQVEAERLLDGSNEITLYHKVSPVKKVSNDTLNQRHSIPLDASFDSGIEILPTILTNDKVKVRVSSIFLMTRYQSSVLLIN
ncbi:MAG: hypothetical protein KAG53_00595 [Endozoicomonadaceae bacterium]|nr:hypothetical protein [Endozoicomonadaceae bacterium]